jgi:membrane associated rhomboid family serine protease
MKDFDCIQMKGVSSAEKRKIITSVLYPLLLVAIMWLVEFLEQQSGRNFVFFGLYPRTLLGLRGVLLSPFIHSDMNHLINNSIPLLIMGSALVYFYRKVAFKLFFMIVIIGGLWTWISARPSYHIGASGLVYGLFGFLLASGFIRRHKGLMSLSFLVAFIYGSMVWGILPIDYKVSWEGHLWGLAAGIALAFYFRKRGPQREVYVWEEDEDENDNENEIPPYWNSDHGSGPIQLHYWVVPTSDKEQKSNS